MAQSAIAAQLYESKRGADAVVVFTKGSVADVRDAVKKHMQGPATPPVWPEECTVLEAHIFPLSTASNLFYKQLHGDSAEFALDKGLRVYTFDGREQHVLIVSVPQPGCLELAGKVPSFAVCTVYSSRSLLCLGLGQGARESRVRDVDKGQECALRCAPCGTRIMVNLNLANDVCRHPCSLHVHWAADGRGQGRRRAAAAGTFAMSPAHCMWLSRILLQFLSHTHRCQS